MIDREKVIKALERCLICDISVVATPEAQKAYLECEYTVGRYCGRKNVLRDALSLLKEQQQEIWELQDQVEYFTDKQKEQEATIEILVKDITFHNCNNCNRKDCKSKPNAGQPVRSNCIYWLESR